MRSWSFCLLLGAAFAMAALMTPGAASAATCPPGQTGTPPYCVTPPPPPPHCEPGQVGTPPNCITPAISVKGVKVAGNNVFTTFEVNAPGTVSVSGKGIKQSSATTAGGALTIKLALTKQAKKVLRRKGKVRLKLTAIYQPVGATAITRNLTVVVKKHKHRKHGHKRRRRR